MTVAGRLWTVGKAVTVNVGAGVGVFEATEDTVDVMSGVGVNVLSAAGAAFVGGSVMVGVREDIGVQAKELNKSKTEEIKLRMMCNTIPLFSGNLFQLIKL